MSAQNQFENALRANGDTGKTYRLRRTNGERFSDTTLDSALEAVQSRIGRSAAMSVLAHTPGGPVAEVKFNPQLSLEETAALEGLRLAIETGTDSVIV